MSIEQNDYGSALIFYGPYACDRCFRSEPSPVGGVQIIKVAVEQGGQEYDYPSGPIYPNTRWVPHVHRGNGTASPAASMLADHASNAVLHPSVPNGGDSGVSCEEGSDHP